MRKAIIQQAKLGVFRTLTTWKLRHLIFPAITFCRFLSMFSLPARSSFSHSPLHWRLNNRCHAKRAVTAVPEWLCQQQCWGSAFQLAHHAGKGERMMGGKKNSSPQMMPAGSHRALNFAGWFSLFSALWPPDSDLQTEPYWAFLHGRAQAAALSRKKKKRWQRNKEISTNTWEKLFSLQMLD